MGCVTWAMFRRDVQDFSHAVMSNASVLTNCNKAVMSYS